MFLNCNWCCRPYRCEHDRKDCKTPEKNCCEIRDKDRKCKECDRINNYNYNKCDKHPCFNHNENNCNKNNNLDCCDKYRNFSNEFEIQNSFIEYNGLTHFNQQDNCGCRKEDSNKSYRDETESYGQGFEKNYYTRNWDNDKNYKCEKDKNDKYDRPDNNKYCKPVKYICIPCDKY